MERRFNDLQLGSLELFCLAAERGSFSAAAQAGGVTPAAVSRAMARLESRLGVRLFQRTTRSLRLTDAGRGYFDSCRSALGQLAEAERLVTGAQQLAAGRVRMSLPTTYGHYRVLPQLAAFRARHPGVDVDIHLSNRNVDLAEEPFDLVVRMREPRESTLVSRKLEEAELVVVGSPGYLRRAGTPRRVRDLERHECIQFELPSTGRPVPWLLRERGRTTEVATRGGLRVSADVLGGVTLARAGAGLFQTYRFIVAEDLSAGRLVTVLDDAGGASRPVYALWSSARHMPLRVRVLVDFLVAIAAPN
jgi:DNA-binding transcriptional LysR family regulator